MTKPQISIIIPVYNAEKYLRKCIESVIAQTYKDWEAILVNDGSKDSSLAICQEYADKEERIRVIDKENGGVSSARNRGLAVARGEWITFMDSDDWLDDDAFQVYIETAQRTGADILKTGYRCHQLAGIDDKKIETEITLRDKSDILSLLQKSGYEAYVWNMFVSARIAKQNHFDETISWFEDQFFCYDCLLMANRVTLVPNILYDYRLHDSGSLSDMKDPFVIASSVRRDMEYKLLLFANKNKDALNKCWNTYHQLRAVAIDSLYRNGYSYCDRRKFYKNFMPLDGKNTYAEEKKFFEGIKPFWLNDMIEILKRNLKKFVQ